MGNCPTCGSYLASVRGRVYCRACGRSPAEALPSRGEPKDANAYLARFAGAVPGAPLPKAGTGARAAWDARQGYRSAHAALSAARTDAERERARRTLEQVKENVRNVARRLRVGVPR